MGSIGKAIKTGFICRLCSKQKKVLTHLFSARAKRMCLMDKVKLLPISLSINDNLPMTVCEACISRLDLQYSLIKQIRKSAIVYELHRNHGSRDCPAECPLHGILRE